MKKKKKETQYKKKAERTINISILHGRTRELRLIC